MVLLAKSDDDLLGLLEQRPARLGVDLLFSGFNNLIKTNVVLFKPKSCKPLQV